MREELARALKNMVSTAGLLAACVHACCELAQHQEGHVVNVPLLLLCPPGHHHRNRQRHSSSHSQGREGNDICWGNLCGVVRRSSHVWCRLCCWRKEQSSRRPVHGQRRCFSGGSNFFHCERPTLYRCETPLGFSLHQSTSMQPDTLHFHAQRHVAVLLFSVPVPVAVVCARGHQLCFGHAVLCFLFVCRRQQAGKAIQQGVAAGQDAAGQSSQQAAHCQLPGACKRVAPPHCSCCTALLLLHLSSRADVASLSVACHLSTFHVSHSWTCCPPLQLQRLLRGLELLRKILLNNFPSPFEVGRCHSLSVTWWMSRCTGPCPDGLFMP